MLTFALYQVAGNPEYAQVLREEVEKLVRTEGWTKDTIGKLHRMDSLMKECLRLYSVSNGMCGSQTVLGIAELS